MKLSRIKRWTLLGHRWLGIGTCLLFVLWFLSGMVMMYVGHPRLTWQERLAHLPPLDAGQPLLSPAQAFRQAGITGAVSDLRLANARAGQPVYTARVQSPRAPAASSPLSSTATPAPPSPASSTPRISPAASAPPETHLVVIDARTGQRLPATDPETALASARVYLEQDSQSKVSQPSLGNDSRNALQHAHDTSPSASLAEQAAPAHTTHRHLGTTAEDAHTHSKAMDLHRPLHKVLLPDADQTLLYVSGTTGEVVRDAPRLERGFNYLGAWLHWLYLFRDTAIDWTGLIIWLSVIGIVSVLSGFFAGIIRWRFSRPYRSGSHSPFAPGALRWHHILGLVFALSTFTWIFSGLMSMNPWDIFEADDGIIDARRISSPDIHPSRATATPQALLATAATPVRELQWHTILGRPLVQIIRADGIPAADTRPVGHDASRTEGSDRFHATAVDSHLSERLLSRPRSAASDSSNYPVLLSARTGKSYVLKPERLRSALFTLQPGYPPRIDILQQDDFYYYTRAGHTMSGGRKPHPLPIWRARYDDPNRTWLHIDPATGQVLNEMDRRQRIERWLFALLHSWDWLPLLRNRPLWDILMLVLAGGGLLLSATGIWIAGHRLHIKIRRWRLLRRKTRRE